MAFYSPTPTPTTDDIYQLERWLRREHGEIEASGTTTSSLLKILYDNVVFGGYGGIGLDAETPLASINATPQILPFDVELISNPRGVSYGLASNGLIFDVEGVWRMNAKVSLQFLELNAGRRMTLRLYDVNKATEVGPEFNFAVGRNTDGVNLNFNLLVEIPESLVGDTLVLRVFSDTDTFTGVTGIGSIWDANQVGEYRGDAFDREVRSRSRWQ